jgi:hypothetical protein
MHAIRKAWWAFLVLVFVGVQPPKVAQAALITGSDYAGADLLPGDGDVLSGTFTNVGLFHVPAGTTVFVDPGVPLSIEADQVLIEGTLDGTGAGYAGAPTTTASESAGAPGSGPGGGAGGGHGDCVHSSGGGGGGYGGAGGASGSYLGFGPPPAAGGSTYGTDSGSDLDMGSGGGAAGSHCSFLPGDGAAGGAGGASITLTSPSITIDGSLLADGAAGADGTPNAEFPSSAGGGGSGGGVILCGTGTVSGLVSARGGDGGDVVPSLEFANGGGGGGGGRVKTAPGIVVTGTIDVSGGALGTSSTSSTTPAEAGTAGTSTSALEGCPAPIDDTTPPAVSCTVTKSTLWPATRGMIDVGLTATATDDVDASPTLLDVVVYSDEDNGAAPYSPDATWNGTTLKLRAERAIGTGATGRIYVIVVRFADDAGNVGHHCCTVVVPLTMTTTHLTALAAEAATAEEACDESPGTPPSGMTTILGDDE